MSSLSGGTLSATITLDTDQFEDGLNRVSKGIKKHNREIRSITTAHDKLDKSIKKIVMAFDKQYAQMIKGMTSVSDKAKVINNSIRALAVNTDRLSKNLQDSKRSVSDFSRELTPLSRSAKSLQTSLGGATRNLSLMRGGLSKTKKSLANTSASFIRSTKNIRKSSTIINEALNGTASSASEAARQVRNLNTQARNLGRLSLGDLSRRGSGGGGRGRTHLSSPLLSFAAASSVALQAFYALKMAAFDWQVAILNSNASLEQSIQLLKNFSKATTIQGREDDAKGMFKDIVELSQEAPYSIDALTNSFVKFQTTGLKPVIDSFDTLVDGAAKFGKTDEDLKRASIAIQQMVGKGVVSMEELRQQLGEVIPDAIQIMSRSLGLSYSELVKQVSEGKVLAGPAVTAMFSQMAIEVDGAAKTLMQTYNGLLAKMKTSWEKLLWSFGDSTNEGGTGYFATVKNQMIEITALMDHPAMHLSFKRMGDAAGRLIERLAEMVRWMMENKSAVMSIVEAFVLMAGASVIGRVIAGVMKLRGAILLLSRAMGTMSGLGVALSVATGPIGKLIAVIGASTAALINYMGKSVEAAEEIVRANEILKSGRIGKRLATASELEEAEMISASKGTTEVIGGFQALVEREKKKVAELKALAEGAEDALANLANNKSVMKLLNIKRMYGGGTTFGGDAGEFKALIEEKLREAEAGLKYYTESLGDSITSSVDEIAKMAFAKNSSASTEALSNIQENQSTKIKELWESFNKATSGMNARDKNKERQSTFLEQDKIALAAFNESLAFLEENLAAARAALSKPLPVDEAERAKEIAYRQKIVELNEKELETYKASRKEQLENSKLSRETPYLIEGQSQSRYVPPNEVTVFQRDMIKNIEVFGARTKEANEYLGRMYALIQSMPIDNLANDHELASMERLAIAAWDISEGMKAAKEARSTITKYAQEAEKIRGQIAGTGNQFLTHTGNIGKIKEDISQAVTKINEAKKSLQTLVGGGSVTESQLRTIAENIKGLRNYEDSVESIMSRIGQAGQLSKKEMENMKASIAELSNYSTELVNQSAGFTVLSFEQTAAKIAELNTTLAQELSEEDAEIMSFDKTLMELDAVEASLNDWISKNTQVAASNEKMISELSDSISEYRSNINEAKTDASSEMNRTMKSWIKDSQDWESIAVSGIDNFASTLSQALVTGELNFENFTQSLLAMISEIVVKMAIANAIIAGSKMFSSTSSTTTVSTGGGGPSMIATPDDIFNPAGRSAGQAMSGFAERGVGYTPRSVPLSGADNGEKSAALSGLPGSGQKNVPPSVTVNVLNQSGERVGAQKGETKFDGESMVTDIILKKLSQPGPVRDSVRSIR